MYEYIPKLNKSREKIWLGVCMIVGALAYGVGNLLPYPALYQLLSVAAFVVAVLISVRYLLRDYIYRITPKSDGEGADLTVVEVMGKRRSVVCRVSVSDIQSVTSLTERRRQKMSNSCEKIAVYRYVSEFQPQNAWLLEVLDDEKTYFLEICADSELISLLEDLKKQYLSDL